MNEKQFHAVDPESLKHITIDDILTGHNIAPTEMEYFIPVPTQSQSLSHRSRDTWLQVEWGGLDPASLPELDSSYRGCIGGC